MVFSQRAATGERKTPNFGSRPAITAGLGVVSPRWSHHLPWLTLQRQVGRYLLATAAAIIYAAGTLRYTGLGRNLHGNEFFRNTFPVGLYNVYLRFTLRISTLI